MNWKPVGSDVPGTTHYKSSKPKAEAWIHRQDGKLEAEAHHGFLQLDRVGLSCGDKTESDAVVLSKLEDSISPPRFKNWKEVDDQEARGVTHYRGEAGNSKVEAFITRVGDGAEYKAKVGHFGLQIEGGYIGPAPSDQEILKRLSRDP